MTTLTIEIPLLYRTPDRWSELPLSRPLELLNDHAYLERKATSNALELLNRWPNAGQPKNWSVTLAAIARVGTHLRTAVRDGQNLKARHEMMVGDAETGR